MNAQYLKVHSSIIYPVKSAGGIQLQSNVTVVPTGLDQDRSIMLVEPKTGMMISQRKDSKLALVKTEIMGKMLRVSTPDGQVLPINLYTLPSESLTPIEVTVHDDVFRIVIAPEIISLWFSTYLERDVIACYFPRQQERVRETSSVDKPFEVSGADGYPIHLISTASIRDLNERIGYASEPMTIDRFRPNIVIENCEPYFEDTQRTLKIGSAIIKWAKCTPRCHITLVNQQTARKGKEPLRTLADYKTREDGKTVLGSYWVVTQPGTFNVGDPVLVLE